MTASDSLALDRTVADYRPRQLPPRYALGPILPYIAILSKGFMGQAYIRSICPYRLWTHAYDNQIEEASQMLLLVLYSLGTEARIDFLSKAFIAYQKQYIEFHNVPFSKKDTEAFHLRLFLKDSPSTQRASKSSS